MKIVFCSNYMNHHQLYLSRALIGEGVDYRFIASERIEDERRQGGWEDMNSRYDWIVRAYESDGELNRAKKLIYEADLVIAGSFPMKYLRKRVLSNRPVFLYSERWFKTNDGDVSPFKTVRNFLSDLLHRKYFNFFRVYMLCASAYTAYDCRLYGNFRNKCFKWGYFPRTVSHDIDALLAGKSGDKVKLLWVGRLIDWKHPEYCVELAKRLRDDGCDISFEMVGVGPMYDELKERIANYGIGDTLKLVGTLGNEEVRERMERADIYLITSDFKEGWGAVLNEAMNSGCAVVASSAIGSAPFLIEDGKNGCLFSNGDQDAMYRKVKRMIDDPTLRRTLGRNAYRTIAEEWNAENAAKKLLALYDKLINNAPIEIETGVCSPAPVIDGKGVSSAYEAREV